MKKTKLLALACTLLLCGCSSNNANTGEMPTLPELTTTSETEAETVQSSETVTEAVTTAVSSETETSTAEISETTSETTSEAAANTINETTAETSAESTSESVSEIGSGFDTENALIMFLEEHTGGYEFHEAEPRLFGDFDKDGKNELIAYIEAPDTATGYNLWFASGGYIELIAPNSENPVPNIEIEPEIVYSGDNTFIKLEYCYESNSVSDYFRIVNSQVVPCTIEGYARQELRPDGDTGDFTAAHSTYDLCSDGTGHTWKSYWLYFSHEDNTFYPYVGHLMTEEELLKYEGASEVLENARSEGYKIADIYIRENNIININLREYWENACNSNDTPIYENKFINLKITGNSVENITPEYNDGFYKP
ncbi:MAG: hypothetical protein J5999_02475 [Oscillospiraceae bacterium]|nr:hypothetical protein [Oscillospiraceae bacterium]